MIQESEQYSKSRHENKFTELELALRQSSEVELLKLREAYDFAKKIYGDKLKESGETQIFHCLSVALIVAKEIGMRANSVIAALLHDVIDSPDENLDEVEQRFGKDVSDIIKGFKKVSTFHSEKISLQSENFRKLFMSMINDLRVIFIKMAHRLYDMRVFRHLPAELQNQFLNDVIFLYTPIAHRLGMYQIKAEFEDLAMKWSNQEAYNLINYKLQETKKQQEAYINGFAQPIKKKLIEEGIRFEIKSRAKSINSIKKKMDTQGVPFEQVYDLFAIRVILQDVISNDDIQFIEEFQEKLENEGDPGIEKKHKKNKDEKAEADKKQLKPVKSELADEEENNTERSNKQDRIHKFMLEKKRFNELRNREKTACWQAYSVITNIYQPNPKRFRDWITTPKNSGYESLHTTVLGPENRWVEVQIRTQRMDDVAERGDAAHWRYKESAYGKSIAEWMVEVRNVLDTIGAKQLDDGTTSKISQQSEKIYVFTPKGDLHELSAGSTILDFAFDIHTDIGSKCTGGKINGKVFPIRHKLSNGDRVEIITSKGQKPNLDWLNFVMTSKAKARINRSIREEKFKEAEAGKETLMRKFKNWKIDFNDRNITKVVKEFGFKKPLDLYFSVATGKVDLQEIKHSFHLIEEIDEKPVEARSEHEIAGERIESQSGKDEGYIMIDAGVSNLNYSLSKCCNPIAGDLIFGFVTVKQGIKIHRSDCPNALQMKKRYPYRVMKARWKETQNMKYFITNLKILGSDRMGLVSDITKVISDDLKVNMKDLNFKSENAGFVGVIKVQVHDVDHLTFLKKKLLSIKGVTKVVRYD